MESMIPPSLALRRERENTWKELDNLVTKMERGSMRSLSARELGRLPLLYRSTMSSLASARSMSLNRNLLEYLENLCGRAYGCMNQPQPRIRHAIGVFVSRSFPGAVRRYGMHLLAATLVFFLGAGVGWVMTAQDQEQFYTFVPEEYAQGRGPSASTEALRDVLYTERTNTDQLSAFSAMLVSNNARIGLMCFALGVAFGIPVLYLLFTNGMILGAFGALYASRGLGWDFFGWVLPHGVTEILAVLLCGAAGLALAQAAVVPGRRTRLGNLAHVARTAGVIAIGAVALFFLAALIEGFFRQLVNDIVLRYGVTVLTSLLWLTYFAFAGREPATAAQPRPATAAEGAA